MSRGAPSRVTRTRGALSTASRSSVRLARSSCRMPISALVTSTTPNRASCGWPTTKIRASKTPRMKLNRVRMFARKISATGRLVRSPPAFVKPRERRSATCALVRPAGGVSTIGAAGAGGNEGAASAMQGHHVAVKTSRTRGQARAGYQWHRQCPRLARPPQLSQNRPGSGCRIDKQMPHRDRQAAPRCVLHLNHDPSAKALDSPQQSAASAPPPGLLVLEAAASGHHLKPRRAARSRPSPTSFVQPLPSWMALMSRRRAAMMRYPPQCGPARRLAPPVTALWPLRLLSGILQLSCRVRLVA